MSFGRSVAPTSVADDAIGAAEREVASTNGPLKSLHPESSLNKSSLDYFRNQPTDKIVESLRPRSVGTSQGQTRWHDHGWQYASPCPSGTRRRCRFAPADALWLHMGRPVRGRMTMDLRQRILACLRPDSRLYFLASLAHHLGISGRAEYIESGAPLERAVQWLHGHNEMMLIVADQLRRTIELSEEGRPDDVFIDALIERATMDGCRDGLATAFQFAVTDAEEEVDR